MKKYLKETWYMYVITFVFCFMMFLYEPLVMFLNNTADWIFVYAGDGDFTDETFSGNRADFPHIPAEYNEYPHSEEQFYLKIRYQEGLHEISKLKFNFRYMTAEGQYTLWEGNERTIKWTAQAKAEECTTGKDCPCGGHHKNAADTDGDGVDDCSGGAVKCPHGYYEHHWESISVAVDAKYTEEKIDVQDLAEVTSHHPNLTN